MIDLAPVLAGTLLLVAHPDDETVGCGALLQRMSDPIVVFATDGAPRDSHFWSKYGSRMRYSRVREEEARRALGVIGVSEVEFIGLQPVETESIADQELHCHLRTVFERVSALITRHRPDAVLTHAYEGGHPDHDSCSFVAAQLAARHGLHVWEFPLYHRAATGQMAYQRFILPSDREESVLEITPDEAEYKREMLAAYASQQEVLGEFDLHVERFRPQHAYDYSLPPHRGQLNYEAWGWPITGAKVCERFHDFMQQVWGRVLDPTGSDTPGTRWRIVS